MYTAAEQEKWNVIWSVNVLASVLKYIWGNKLSLPPALIFVLKQVCYINILFF